MFAFAAYHAMKEGEFTTQGSQYSKWLDSASESEIVLDGSGADKWGQSKNQRNKVRAEMALFLL